MALEIGLFYFRILERVPKAVVEASITRASEPMWRALVYRPCKRPEKMEDWRRHLQAKKPRQKGSITVPLARPPPPTSLTEYFHRSKSRWFHSKMNELPHESAKSPQRDQVIWMYWVDDPSGKPRPPYLDVCLRSIYLRSECQVCVCGQTKAHELLPELPSAFDHLIPAHQADVFRVGVLAKYGGMYLDFDTFVLKSLRGLFDLLNDYEYVGADWYPENPDLERAPLSISVLGPARPKLNFLISSFERQLALLREHSRPLQNGSDYPFKWEELLKDVVVPFFIQNRPRCFLKNGAKTWAALAGGPAWIGGDYGHMLMPMDHIRNELPCTELLTVCHSVWPEELRHASLEVLKCQDTILSYLINMIEKSS
jgi:Glycosyltransferase sugar-binding region containing DXD motif